MNIIRTLFLLAIFGVLVHAQPAQTPNCGPFNVTFTSATNTTPIPNSFIRCSFWTPSYISNGFSAESVELQSAPDLNGVPDTFVTFAGTLLTGANPATATTQAQATFSGFYPWLRIKVNSVTGTGSIRAQLYGYQTGGGGGGTGTQAFQTNSSVTVAAASGANFIPLDGILFTGANNPTGTYELQIAVDRATTPTKISSGTIALGTSLITTGACATVATASAVGTLTTDIVSFSLNGDISAVTGYAPVTTGGLSLYVYPTADTVNVKVCNPTASSITPGAVTLNYLVGR